MRAAGSAKAWGPGERRIATEGAAPAARAASDPEGGLTLDDLDYDLPPSLIAQRPVEPRDASRLLVVRRDGALEDRRFTDLPGLLRAGDLLVRNDTRVLPARAHFRRASGGRVEALFVRPLTAAPAESPHVPGRGRLEGGVAATQGRQDAPEAERWEALLRGRPRRGESLVSEALGDGWRVRCVEALGGGRWVLESEASRPVRELLEAAGTTPLPPYIHEPLDDPERYQTHYARAAGSAAAPTAGLHFTPALDAALAAAGVELAAVTLHVGLGTFHPLRAERLADNRLHGERFAVDAAVWRRVRAARGEGRRVVAVGTTTVRVLEHLAREEARGEAPTSVIAGETDLFITPGFRFAVVDALLTNFHLPRSSLLALVMAFCGVEATRAAYRHAVAERYRFYSFGDAMLAL